MIDQHEESCRVLIFQGASTSALQRMIALARGGSDVYWKKSLPNATQAGMEMLYIHLSNGLIHVIIDYYDRFNRQEVIGFVKKIVKGSLSPFQ